MMGFCPTGPPRTIPGIIEAGSRLASFQNGPSPPDIEFMRAFRKYQIRARRTNRLSILQAVCFLIVVFGFPPQPLRSQSNYFHVPVTNIRLLTQAKPGGGGTTDSTETTTTEASTNSLNGFSGIGWKSDFTTVRSHLKNLSQSPDAEEKVEILNVVRNRSILVRRNGVLYRYSFYKTPLNIERINNHSLSEEEYDQKEALLFHVRVTMPLIEAGRVKEKLEQSFGRASRTTVRKDMMGASIWELNGGLIFQWHEPYHRIAFTRNVDYLSREMVEVIMKEYEQYFDARERYILKMILLR